MTNLGLRLRQKESNFSQVRLGRLGQDEASTTKGNRHDRPPIHQLQHLWLRGVGMMATVRKDISVSTSTEEVWNAIRDIGALHTKLVPGFVVDTRLEAGARIVTFQDGLVVREPIITLDEQRRRLVWSVEGIAATHYNASVQVDSDGSGSHIVWIADFLPDEISSQIEQAMEAGAQAMRAALDR